MKAHEITVAKHAGFCFGVKRATDMIAEKIAACPVTLAVKSGVGMKCRDLLTGDELFLMETSFSKGDVKGMTV